MHMPFLPNISSAPALALLCPPQYLQALQQQYTCLGTVSPISQTVQQQCTLQLGLPQQRSRGDASRLEPHSALLHEHKPQN